jgi:hypothetical protein
MDRGIHGAMQDENNYDNRMKSTKAKTKAR